MEKQNLEQFKFKDEFKEKLVLMVVYQNHSPKSLVKKYVLPNPYILSNWVRIYKKTLEKGAVTLLPGDTTYLNPIFPESRDPLIPI